MERQRLVIRFTRGIPVLFELGAEAVRGIGSRPVGDGAVPRPAARTAVVWGHLDGRGGLHGGHRGGRVSATAAPPRSASWCSRGWLRRPCSPRSGRPSRIASHGTACSWSHRSSAPSRGRDRRGARRRRAAPGGLRAGGDLDHGVPVVPPDPLGPAALAVLHPLRVEHRQRGPRHARLGQHAARPLGAALLLYLASPTAVFATSAAWRSPPARCCFGSRTRRRRASAPSRCDGSPGRSSRASRRLRAIATRAS